MVRCKYANHFDDITCYNRAIGYIIIRLTDLGDTGKLKIPICKLHKDFIYEKDGLKITTSSKYEGTASFKSMSYR